MKAIALFSGGLDSCLCIKIIQNMGIEVEAVNINTGFESNFKKEEYLKRDRDTLLKGIKTIFKYKKLVIISIDSIELKAKGADMALKELGYLLSSKQRDEITKSNSIVIGGEWAVVYQDNRLYISPFLNISMPKKYKELCRVSSVPIKIRPYLYTTSLKPIDIISYPKLSI